MATGRKATATVNDLTGKRSNTMRKSKLLRKPGEGDPKWSPRLLRGHKSNRLIDAKINFYGTYITVNEQVTLQNHDPSH